jgi:hypothetical protein
MRPPRLVGHEPSVLYLLINVKTAKAVGLTIRA